MKQSIMIIGGGQLCLMMCEESYKLKDNIDKIYIYCDKLNTPCSYIDFIKYNYIELIIDDYNNENKIKEIASKCNYITYEFESFNTKVFESSDIKKKVFPSIDFLKIIQDKYKQKKFINNNIFFFEDTNFEEINCFDDIINFIKKYDYPVFLKSRFGAFDGRGNFLIKDVNDLKNLKNIESNIYFIEKFINFDKELSIAGCKNKKDEIISYNIVENTHKNSILVETKFPAMNLSSKITKKINKIFESILKLLDTKGIICVELFMKDDLIYYNELCLRVHNSMHYTLNACINSQFENHLRSILGLNISENKYLFEGIFYNIISNLQELKDVNEKENFDEKKHYIKMYNKESKGIRKIGHITFENIIEVGIIMGSDSDLPTMKDACIILDKFNIKYECRIVSAHRTPTIMYSYAQKARDRGIRVIIAGAGGAAHLPGMVASLTTLPVIGVPIMTSAFQGNDSLLSIVQMPKGVPVATVAIGNATNAALLAVRILSCNHNNNRGRELMLSLDKFISQQENDVMQKAEKLERNGYSNYLK